MPTDFELLNGLQGEQVYYQATRESRYFGHATRIYADGRADIVVSDAGLSGGTWSVRSIPFGPAGQKGCWCFRKLPQTVLDEILHPQKEELFADDPKPESVPGKPVADQPARKS